MRWIISVIAGAALWGTIGWYVRGLEAKGFSPMEIVTLRVTFAWFFLSLYITSRDRSALKIKQLKHVVFFIGTGIGSIVFFNYCLFASMSITTIPVATSLLYTGPAFVLIFSAILFKESLTVRKILALALTLTGVTFAVGAFPPSSISYSFKGVLLGLGAGLGYGFYSIFSKYAQNHYSTFTITFYTFLIAAVSLLPFFPFAEKWSVIISSDSLMYALGLGILPTALAYILYTNGLEKMEASSASILSTIEPVVATMIGMFIFNEAFSIWQAVGMAFIISAVILIARRRRPQINNVPQEASC
ncbi:DMT family transporter [Thalassobacillus sp. CUG 92003]|uniref:DMT family transporter n=1 Tax=Thalassobacillus sp. CUG 92003 TaxID=2736641 RepID=UPI0015E7DA4B|nr:EamA family transporter [Thalassobacillus sp. CUG 92003]